MALTGCLGPARGEMVSSVVDRADSRQIRQGLPSIKGWDGFEFQAGCAAERRPTTWRAL